MIISSKMKKMVEKYGFPAPVSETSLVTTLSNIVDIPTPTGDEEKLSRWIVDKLASYGCESELQRVNDNQSNALGVLKGKGRGKSVLLYAPLDTVTSNSEIEDIPWLSSSLRPEMRAKAFVKDGHIYGLGAQNPKGGAACIIEAARVLNQLDTPLEGDVYFGFGAGGMPTSSRPGLPTKRSGHGIGCIHMLSNMPRPDAAIVAKPGFAVTWEEVGFIWIDVNVAGDHTYVGSRHLMPYSSAIANASKLILKLEEWFEERAEAHATECVKPQGVVSFIESGWERMPAFTGATCRFRLDLRFGPDFSGDDIEEEFGIKLNALCSELGVEAVYRRIQTIEASRTDFESEIVQTSISAWESVKGREHVPFTEMSGGTDANITRSFGVPTARMGLPKVDLPDIDFQTGMNCAAVADMRDLTTMLVLSAIDFCGGVANG